MPPVSALRRSKRSNKYYSTVIAGGPIITSNNGDLKCTTMATNINTSTAEGTTTNSIRNLLQANCQQRSNAKNSNSPICWFGLAACTATTTTAASSIQVPTMDRLDSIDDDSSIDTLSCAVSAPVITMLAPGSNSHSKNNNSSTDSLMSSSSNTCDGNNEESCSSSTAYSSENSLGLCRSRMRKNSVHLSSLVGAGEEEEDELLQTTTHTYAAPSYCCDPMSIDERDVIIDEDTFLDCLTIADDDDDPWGHFVDVFHASSSTSVSSSSSNEQSSSPPRFGLLCKSKPYASSRAPDHLRGFLSFT